MVSLLDVLVALDNLIPTNEDELDFRRRMQIGPRSRPDQSKISISKVLITPAIYGRVLTKATSEFFNLIISYYSFLDKSQNISGRKWAYVRLLAKNYINVYVLGNPWLTAENGANASLANILNLTKLQNNPKILQDKGISLFNGSEYISKLISIIKEKLNPSVLRIIGDIDNEVGTVAIKSGVWDIPDDLEILREYSVNTIITGELSFPTSIEIYNRELNVIEIGALTSLKSGITRLAQALSFELEDVVFEPVIIEDPREVIL